MQSFRFGLQISGQIGYPENEIFIKIILDLLT
jgi:hypothetical protein